MSTAPRTLVLRFTSLGDVVLSSVLLDALREVHPSAHVSLVTKRIYAGFFARDERVDETFFLEEGESVFALARRLEAEEFDLVLDAHGSLRSRLLTLLLAPSALRRIDKDTLDRELRLRWRVDRPRLRRRFVDRCLDLVPGASRDHRPRLPGIPRPADDSGPPRLAMAPGARHAPKQWPVERFASVARRMMQEHRAQVVILGSSAESKLARAMQEMAGEGVVDATGDRALEEVAAQLASCRLLLCNDSGLLHVAEAVDTPVVALYGPTTRDWGYFPLHPGSRALEVDLPCRPCSKNGARACSLAERLCMTMLGEDEVLRAVEDTWKQSANVALPSSPG